MDYTKYSTNNFHSDTRPIESLQEYKEILTHLPFEYIKYKCLKEMYERAQPSVDLDDLLNEHFERISQGLEAERFFERYFLSQQEYNYILNKYVEDWYLKDHWNDHFELLLKDVQEKHIKDKYIPEHTDEYGNTHPGHRGYEDALPLKDIIGEDNAQKVIEFIKDRQKFYKHSLDENAFRAQVALGILPNSNHETVIKYWADKGVNLDIDLRKHSNNYFWCEEQGYDEEELKEVEEHEQASDNN